MKTLSSFGFSVFYLDNPAPMLRYSSVSIKSFETLTAIFVLQNQIKLLLQFVVYPHLAVASHPSPFSL
jgi:hypothetical protein